MKEKEAFQKSLGSSSVINIWKVAQSVEEGQSTSLAKSI